MRRLLIVSPHFPPVNAPDMQRVRMSLPYFAEFGWEPTILTVRNSGDSAVLDPMLSKTVPPSADVRHVASLPPSLARRMGVGDAALRAWPWLYREGARLIRQKPIDAVYFSTTAFFSMPMGRVWHERFGVPYVLDIQDPWLSDYYETHPEATAPAKHALSHRLHGVLEPWTMAKTAGLIAVSDAYIDTLRRRYPWIRAEACATIPFAAAESDFALLRSQPQPNGVFARDDDRVHAVYVGRGGDDMAPALRILFEGVKRAPALAKLQMHFVGTDYAAGDRARKTVEPLAAISGLLPGCVREQTKRAPYFEALQLLTDADLLLLVGSDDPQYTASKVYPYLLARKPIVAVVHEKEWPRADPSRCSVRARDIRLRDTRGGSRATGRRADGAVPERAACPAAVPPSRTGMLGSRNDPSAMRGLRHRGDREKAGRVRTRLAIVVSHPIQYQAPWFRALAKAVDLTVFFCHRQTTQGRPTPGSASTSSGTCRSWTATTTSGSRTSRNILALRRSADATPPICMERSLVATSTRVSFPAGI